MKSLKLSDNIITVIDRLDKPSPELQRTLYNSCHMLYRMRVFKIGGSLETRGNLTPQSCFNGESEQTNV